VVSVVRSSFRAPSQEGPPYSNVVQTDAALNPGNSGGPLISASKKLVGVNTATLTRVGNNPIQGQGYAIGVDRVKEVVGPLRSGHSQGWAGFGLVFPHGKGGARVPGVVAVPMGESPASSKALGTLVTQINGAKIGSTFGSYCDAVRSIGSGQTAVLTVLSKPGAAPKQVRVKFL
jgi:S1-C subfamily serine protease